MHKKDKDVIKMSLIIMVIAIWLSYSLATHAETVLKNGTYIGTVVKVVDGDTLKLDIKGKTLNVRLAGIDTPETYNNKKAKKDISLCGVSKETMFSLGNEAKKKVLTLYHPNDVVSLKVVGIGVYGRPIVWINGLSTNLVAGGYARVVEYNNLPKATINMLMTLQTYAIKKNLGIWKKLDCWK